jgi:hypothetical protein
MRCPWLADALGGFHDMAASSSSLSSSIFEDGCDGRKNSGDGDGKSPVLQNPSSCFVAGSVRSRAL